MATKSLDFTIGLIDKFTSPLKGVLTQVEKLEKVTDKTTKTFQKIGTGVIALWGVGKAFSALVEPAEEMQRALDLAGLSGVKELDAMRKQAKSFAGEYATNAVDFVNSSVLIKNSINGITDRALPKMTEKINLLAKATGTSAEESTQYMAKMYDDYKQTAIKMGGMNFANNVAGMAAYAKQQFNMSPAQMQAMMSGAKSAGSNYGVDMSEQFAVMGTLNKSMGSGGAGAYEQMLQNMQSAGKQLGLTFTDTNGKLLAMPDILTQLQGKFGKNIDGNIKAQNALNKAFGSGSPAIKALMKDSDKLNEHITALGKNKGLDLVKKMAEANVKPWDKVTANIDNMKESIGRALLPVFNPLFNMLNKTVGKVAKWLEMFPNLAKWIGIVVTAFMALAAVGAVLSIVGGALSLLLSPITLIVLGVLAIAAAAYFLWKNWDDVVAWMCKAWNKVLDTLDNVIIFKPLVFIIRNIGTIFQAVCDGAMWAWDNFKSLITNTIAFQAVMLIFDSIGDSFNAVIALLTGDWDGFVDALTDNAILQAFMAMGESISNVFSSAMKFIKNIFIDSVNWMIEKANYIPGVDIDLIEREDANLNPNLLTGSTINSIDPGGISQEIKSNSSQSIDNSKNISGVTIIAKNGLTPEQLHEWDVLQNG